jgi:hypothetical protein
MTDLSRPPLIEAYDTWLQIAVLRIAMSADDRDDAIHAVMRDFRAVMHDAYPQAGQACFERAAEFEQGLLGLLGRTQLTADGAPGQA